MEQGRLKPNADRLTFDDLAKAIRTHYAIKKHRSADRLETSLNALRAHFALVRATRIPDRLPEYVMSRRKAGAADGTIRLELRALQKAFDLVKLKPRAEQVGEHVPGIDPSKRRKGFLDETGLHALLKHLPEYLQPITEVAFYCGARREELASL